MKRILLALVALFLFLGATPVMADDEPVEIVVIELVEPTYEKAQKYISTPKIYDWDSKVVDSLAEIFWAETGRGQYADTEKLLITQLIFNRLRYGSPFADTLYGVMNQKGEFNHGKISDKNRQKAIDYLNLCQSQYDGYFQGLALPTSAIYMGRIGSDLIFYDDCWNAVYQINK